jgi:hypothetical protein
VAYKIAKTKTETPSKIGVVIKGATTLTAGCSIVERTLYHAVVTDDNHSNMGNIKFLHSRFKEIFQII